MSNLPDGAEYDLHAPYNDEYDGEENPFDEYEEEQERIRMRNEDARDALREYNQE